MEKEIYILGARIDGHAGVIIDTIRLIDEYRVAGFIDNTPGIKGKIIDGIPVLGSTDELDKLGLSDKCFHIAIGDNVARKMLSQKIKTIGGKLITIIHPTAIISKSSKIGDGSFVGPGAIINNGTTVGEVCIINSGSIIEHDNIICDAVHMAPGTTTAGRVKVNELAFVGVGATILPDIEIGSASLVGAGSTVVKNVVSKETVIGYAAKKYKKNIYTETKSDND